MFSRFIIHVVIIQIYLSQEFQNHGKKSMADAQKLNIELPYDLAIPVLGVYPKELKAGT